MTKHVHYNVILAFADGEKIEYWNHSTGTWLNDPIPTFCPITRYRVKPSIDPHEWINTGHGRIIVEVSEDDVYCDNSEVLDYIMRACKFYHDNKNN